MAVPGFHRTRTYLLGMDGQNSVSTGRIGLECGDDCAVTGTDPPLWTYLLLRDLPVRGFPGYHSLVREKDRRQKTPEDALLLFTGQANFAIRS